MNKNTFGAWLRTMRDRTLKNGHTMTQEEFTEALMEYYRKYIRHSDEDRVISKSAVSSWETGQKNAPLHDPDFIQAVARIFNVTGAEVLMGAGFELGPSYTPLQDDQRAALVAEVDRLIAAAQSIKARLTQGG